MKFSTKLIKWYMVNHRDLPWRKTKDPYLIWIAEIILQQTRVNQAGLIGTEGYLAAIFRRSKNILCPASSTCFLEEFLIEN